MNAIALLTCSLSAILLAPAAVGPGGSGGGPNQVTATINIRAWIDGRSQLILDDNTATWQHFDFAAPGRVDCDIGDPYEPTYLEGVAWFPDWPDVPDCENRFCGGCFSSTYTGLQTTIPNVDFTPTLVLIDVRYQAAIVEFPSAANGYRVVIEFNDNPLGGEYLYEVELDISGCGSTTYCTSTPNSSGSAATISVTGSLSASVIDTYLAVDGCPPNRPGLFFYGPTPAQLPFVNGYLCVSPFYPGILRVPPPVSIDPLGHAGVLLNYNVLPPAGTIVAGSTWYFQFWFRDIAAGGAGSNLSNGLRITFCE